MLTYTTMFFQTRIETHFVKEALWLSGKSRITKKKKKKIQDLGNSLMVQWLGL